MAAFDNTPQVQQAPNFTGRSQGIQSSPNTGLGMLFESVAGALDSGIKVADQANKDAITDDIFNQVDSIQSEFGVDDATVMEADAESASPLPAGVQAAGENLARLQNAYSKGPRSGVSESHYWARMNNMVRQLRAKYPGYRAEIDDMVSGVTGAKPANALRSALFNEWNATADADPYAKLVDWAMKDGSLPGDFFNRQESGNPYNLVELQANVATKKRKQSEITDAQSQLSLNNSMGTLNEAEAVRTFGGEAAMAVTTMLADSTSASGQIFTAAKERILDAQRLASLGEPVDTTALVASFAELKGLVSTQLRQLSMNQFGATAADSYVSMIKDPKLIDAQIAQAMWPINIMEDAILNENYGTVASMAAWIESTKNNNVKELHDSFPELGRIQALKEVAGPTVVDLLLAASPTTVHALTKRLLDDVAIKAATGTGTIVDAMDTGEARDQGDDYYNGLITRWQKTVESAAGGNLPLDVVQNNVNFMFGVDSQAVFARMNDNDKFEYYRQVVSPTVTNQMLKLKKQGDEVSWNIYQNWSTNAFVGLFRQSVQNLQGVNTDQKYTGLNVRWDKSINGFVLQADGFMGIGAYQTPATQMNTAIQTIAPILEASGEDVGENILELIEGMGWDADAERGGRFELIESLARAVVIAGGAGSKSTPEQAAEQRKLIEEQAARQQEAAARRNNG